MVYALIKKGKSSLEALGAGWEDTIDVESRVKKVKRFLQSKYTDCQSCFFPYVKPLLSAISKQKELILVIDGSDIGKNCAALMISVVWGKRALPLAWLVKSGHKGHFSVEHHLDLVKQLRSLLPSCERIILLGDGEFDSCELQEYAQQEGWQYVLRTAKNTVIEDKNGDSFAIGECDIEEAMEYMYLEDCLFTQKQYGLVNLLIWHQKNYEEVLYLVSNMDWAKDMMDYYKRRYSIETIFGDIKSRGFNIHKTRVKNPEIIHNLLIIIALAFLLCFAIGIAKDRFKSIITKIIRKDRLHQFSIFQIGKKIAQFIEEYRIPIFKQFSNNFINIFCVRF